MPDRLKFRVTAEVDVEVTDLDALTQAALEQVEGYGFESAAEKDELVLEVMADPAAAVLEVACLDDYLDLLPGLSSRRSDISVSRPNDDAETGSGVTVGRVGWEVSVSPALVAGSLAGYLIRELSGRLTGLSLAELGFDASLPEMKRRKSKVPAELLAGALWRAGVVIVDQAFDDTVLAFSADEYSRAGRWGGWLLPQLPDEYRNQYSPTFVRALAATIIDVTGRLTRGWQPPTSIAEEFAVMFLLDEVQNIVDDARWTLPTGWRERLEVVLGQGSAHLTLASPDEPITPTVVVSEWFFPDPGSIARIPYTAVVV